MNHRLTKNVALGWVLVTALGCQTKKNSSHSLEQRGRTCNDKMATGIVSGRVTEEYSPVSKITIDGSGTCTGTFVSPNTLITAAHCINRHHSFEVNGARASQSKTLGPETDVGVLTFSSEVYCSAVAEINTQPLTGNERITLVGYGQTDYINNNDPDGLKRVGSNQLLGFAEIVGRSISFRSDSGNYIHFRSDRGGADGRAMTGRGDSGGPIFANGKMIGVVSFGGTRSDLLNRGARFQNEQNPETNGLYEFDTNLASTSAQNLLRAAVREIGAVIPGF